MKHPSPGPSPAALVKTATQLRLPSMTTTPSLQSASPSQRENTEPLSATALRETTVAGMKLAWQAVPQTIPSGADVTVLIPGPPFTTESVRGPPISLTVLAEAFATHPRFPSRLIATAF